MRLHLLQAIVAFHLHKIDRARELLNKAALELQMLKVNTDDITQLVALGKFSLITFLLFLNNIICLFIYLFIYLSIYHYRVFYF